MEHIKQGGFEQLCRNYTAEKIRGKFLEGEIGTGSGYEKHDGQKSVWVREAIALVDESREVLEMFEGEDQGRGREVSVRVSFFSEGQSPGEGAYRTRALCDLERFFVCFTVSRWASIFI